MNSLKAKLTNTPPGTISDPSGLDQLLAACWDEFDGSRDGGMEGDKLLDRIEDATWNSPLLSFVIERHGGTVCGSTRGELQHWELDLNAGTAEIIKTGHRQLYSMAPRISIKGMAEEIAAAILRDAEHRGYRRDREGNVKVNASLLFPSGSGYKRTVEARRMRLCDYIGSILADHGWQKVGWKMFGKATSRKEMNQ